MRPQKRWARQALCLALALAVCLPSQAAATTIDEVKERQEALQQENDSLQQTLDSLKGDEEAALAYQEELSGKIQETEGRIDQAQQTIQTMDQEIQVLEQKLDLSQAQYQETIDTFCERLRALYTTGGTSLSMLEILLTSDSFTDFFMKRELVQAVSRHDQQLLDKIAEYVDKTKGDRQALVEAQQQVADSKKEIEAAQDQLEELYAENDALMAALQTQQADVQDKIQQNEEEDTALQQKLEQLIEERNREEQEKKEQAQKEQAEQAEASSGDKQDDSEPAPGGIGTDPVTPGLQSGFSPIWPLPGVGLSSITGHFGDIYSNGPHNGLDIGAAYGTPIVAAQAGEVISAEYHWSWGNNVLVWHNETFSTRYAHMSSLAVSPGQYVEQGQIIGYVGSTGYSSGNHLHFEVYYNNSRVNPDPYLGI